MKTFFVGLTGKLIEMGKPAGLKDRSLSGTDIDKRVLKLSEDEVEKVKLDTVFVLVPSKQEDEEE